jgi:lipid-binding SYLF domain-containing protein
MNIINEAKNKLETWKCKTKAKMEAHTLAKQATKDGTSFIILLMSNEKDDVDTSEGTY